MERKGRKEGAVYRRRVEVKSKQRRMAKSISRLRTSLLVDPSEERVLLGTTDQQMGL